MYWYGSWGYFFPYCPVDKAIQVRKDPVENSVVAALGNTHNHGSNTRRVKFQSPNYCYNEAFSARSYQSLGDIVLLYWVLDSLKNIPPTVLYSTVEYCTVQYCTVLYFTKVYCNCTDVLRTCKK